MQGLAMLSGIVGIAENKANFTNEAKQCKTANLAMVLVV